MGNPATQKHTESVSFFVGIPRDSPFPVRKIYANFSSQSFHRGIFDASVDTARSKSRELTPPRFTAYALELVSPPRRIEIRYAMETMGNRREQGNNAIRLEKKGKLFSCSTTIAAPSLTVIDCTKPSLPRSAFFRYLSSINHTRELLCNFLRSCLLYSAGVNGLLEQWRVYSVSRICLRRILYLFEA